MEIGKCVEWIDAVSKVTGKTRYTVNLLIPGILVSKYLRITIVDGWIKN